MPARLHPGVYVEEVPSAARAIEAAGTSTAIFVGETERGPLEPTKIKGVGDYQRLYGGYKWQALGGPATSVLRYAVDAFFQNGGTSAYVLRAFNGDVAQGTAVTGGRAASNTANDARVVASSPNT